MVRHLQRGQAIARGLLPQITGHGVCNHSHVLAPALAKGVLKPLPHKKILCQRFNGSPGLADAYHGRFCRMQRGKQGFKLFSARIVGNPQAGTGVPRPVLPRGKGFLHGASAKGGSPDAQHQHVPAGSHTLKHRRQAAFKRGPVRH